jgi:hypothetical protein
MPPAGLEPAPRGLKVDRKAGFCAYLCLRHAGRMRFIALRIARFGTRLASRHFGCWYPVSEGD